ncbi:MAG: 3-dehydroquinate dehydratase [Marinilabiliaceae bacterium]|nr:3-dehydroquinate dehydratase [Marinilabiliaceae bacterium]
MKLIIINGPNLNLVGKRETDIYGTTSFEAYFQMLEERYPDIKFLSFQSNSEGEIIDILHRYGFSCSGIIINAGGYSHTSVSIADAISAIDVPVVEVHISNVFKRETFRHKSLIATATVGFISGFGLDSYRLGVEALIANNHR